MTNLTTNHQLPTATAAANTTTTNNNNTTNNTTVRPLSSINYSMVIPVAWLLVDSLGGTERFLGWYLASYSGE